MTRLFALLLLGLTSCSSLVAAPDIPLAGTDPAAAWSRNLAAHVDEAGAIDFDGMADESDDLDLTVAWIAEPRDPELTGEARIAYLVNAYNALAMYGLSLIHI